ncbi:MAG: type II toxin-antitoxin system VapC family toxin [Spirochaetota bacterium]
MNYILDTHVLLWFANNDPRISEKAENIIKTSKNNIFLSSAVVWEISIKLKLGKINIDVDLDTFVSEIIRAYNFIPFPVTIPHAIQVYNLKEIHKDPFDRMLIAQSISSGYPIITSDSQIKKYKVKTVW